MGKKHSYRFTYTLAIHQDASLDVIVEFAVGERNSHSGYPTSTSCVSRTPDGPEHTPTGQTSLVRRNHASISSA
jgi:hypothetical protein